ESRCLPGWLKRAQKPPSKVSLGISPSGSRCAIEPHAQPAGLHAEPIPPPGHLPQGKKPPHSIGTLGPSEIPATKAAHLKLTHFVDSVHSSLPAICARAVRAPPPYERRSGTFPLGERIKPFDVHRIPLLQGELPVILSVPHVARRMLVAVRHLWLISVGVATHAVVLVAAAALAVRVLHLEHPPLAFVGRCYYQHPSLVCTSLQDPVLVPCVHLHSC